MSVQNIQGQFESNEDTTEVKMEFLTPEEIQKLQALVVEWGKLSMSQQILALNSLAEKMNGQKVSPLQVKTREGELIGPYGTHLSKLSSFNPCLAAPHSGQGFATFDHLDIRHPALLAFEITVGECGNIEEGEVENSKEIATKRKVAFAKKVLQLKWTQPNDNPGTADNRYRAGQTIPDNAMLYHLDYGDGRIAAGPRLSKAGFEFIIEEPPTLRDEDFIVVGTPEMATRVKVSLKIKGHWHSTSEAEKFAAMLTKLCVDKMPVTESMPDLLKGGILLYEDSEETLGEYSERILRGEVTPCPLTDVGSGQETQKGASTAEPCAAWLHALTGKYVLREEKLHTQMVNGKEEEMGYIVWDDDAFVEMREAWNEASIHSSVWVRWVDDWMKEVLQEAVGGSDNFYFSTCDEGGWYFFCRAETRTELAFLTMETSTMVENLKRKPKGSMFFELLQVIGQL